MTLPAELTPGLPKPSEVKLPRPENFTLPTVAKLPRSSVERLVRFCSVNSPVIFCKVLAEIVWTLASFMYVSSPSISFIPSRFSSEPGSAAPVSTTMLPLNVEQAASAVASPGVMRVVVAVEQEAAAALMH